jgi:hypothetical protein
MTDWKSRQVPIAGVIAHAGCVREQPMDDLYTNPQEFTVLRIAISIRASEIKSAASTVTMEDPLA